MKLEAYHLIISYAPARIVSATAFLDHDGEKTVCQLSARPTAGQTDEAAIVDLFRDMAGTVLIAISEAERGLAPH